MAKRRPSPTTTIRDIDRKMRTKPSPNGKPDASSGPHPETPDGPLLTDVGNGDRFAADHRDDARWVPGLGWLVWDGMRWAVDDLKAVERLAKAMVRTMRAEAMAAVRAAVEALDRAADEDAERAAKRRLKDGMSYLDWCRQSEDARRVAAMLAMARSELAERADGYDARPMHFNCVNGTLDLTTGTLRPHDRADRLTQVCPTAFDFDAACPTWETFVLGIMGGRRELVEFLQRLAGYWLTGQTTEHVLPIFHGSGSNGKSVYLETLMAVIGPDYAMKAPSDLLLAKAVETHPTDKADLRGRRLVACVETDDGRRLTSSSTRSRNSPNDSLPINQQRTSNSGH